MRYAQIRNMDVSNGIGIGVALFVQGCHFHCDNCFNKNTWNFNEGLEWTPSIENDFLNIIDKPYIKRISFLGGEPLAPENKEDVLFLIDKCKQLYPNKKIWVWTGYTFDNLPKSILNNIDYLVDGPYIDSLRDYKLKFRGSSNQRIIDVQETLKTGNIKILDI